MRTILELIGLIIFSAASTFMTIIAWFTVQSFENPGNTDFSRVATAYGMLIGFMVMGLGIMVIGELTRKHEG